MCACRKENEQTHRSVRRSMEHPNQSAHRNQRAMTTPLPMDLPLRDGHRPPARLARRSAPAAGREDRRRQAEATRARTKRRGGRTRPPACGHAHPSVSISCWCCPISCARFVRLCMPHRCHYNSSVFPVHTITATNERNLPMQAAVSARVLTVLGWESRGHRATDAD